MNIDRQIGLEHLLFVERKCRVCGQTKELLEGFYLTRKDRGDLPSAYSYECKTCTISRVKESRHKCKCNQMYPDW